MKILITEKQFKLLENYVTSNLLKEDTPVTGVVKKLLSLGDDVARGKKIIRHIDDADVSNLANKLSTKTGLVGHNYTIIKNLASNLYKYYDGKSFKFISGDITDETMERVLNTLINGDKKRTDLLFDELKKFKLDDGSNLADALRSKTVTKSEVKPGFEPEVKANDEPEIKPKEQKPKKTPEEVRVEYQNLMKQKLNEFFKKYPDITDSERKALLSDVENFFDTSEGKKILNPNDPKGASEALEFISNKAKNLIKRSGLEEKVKQDLFKKYDKAFDKLVEDKKKYGWWGLAAKVGISVAALDFIMTHLIVNSITNSKSNSTLIYYMTDENNKDEIRKILRKVGGTIKTKNGIIKITEDDADFNQNKKITINYEGSDLPRNIYYVEFTDVQPMIGGQSYSSLYFDEGTDTLSTTYGEDNTNNPKDSSTSNVNNFENSLKGFTSWYTTPKEKGGNGKELSGDIEIKGDKDLFKINIKSEDGSLEEGPSYEFIGGTFKYKKKN